MSSTRAPLGVLAAALDDRLLIAGSTSASAVAWNRVPMSAPAAPSASAAATPRPSAIPPAASTGVGAARSTTTGTNGSVDRPRRAPCPPASVPCATITSAPRSTACLASSRSVTWMISAAPAARMGGGNGRGSPKDSITARGPCASACSTVPTSTDQLWKPTPHGRLVPLRHDRQLAIQPGRVPAAAAQQAEAAAVARPPRPARRPPIRPSARARSGAGRRTVSVNAVASAMPPSSPQSRPHGVLDEGHQGHLGRFPLVRASHSMTGTSGLTDSASCDVGGRCAGTRRGTR